MALNKSELKPKNTLLVLLLVQASSLLHTLSNTIAESTFQKGIRNYLAENAFAIANPEDLWKTLSEVSYAVKKGALCLFANVLFFIFFSGLCGGRRSRLGWEESRRVHLHEKLDDKGSPHEVRKSAHCYLPKVL